MLSPGVHSTRAVSRALTLSSKRALCNSENYYLLLAGSEWGEAEAHTQP